VDAAAAGGEGRQSRAWAAPLGGYAAAHRTTRLPAGYRPTPAPSGHVILAASAAAGNRVQCRVQSLLNSFPSPLLSIREIPSYRVGLCRLARLFRIREAFPDHLSDND
jgi:hypothetical protein